MNALAPSPPRFTPIAPYLALAGLWLLTLTIVPPRGDFPLNDDWMFAQTVQRLVETGTYQASPYADPTFILQAYWGAAFVKLFGFSFETLRMSTLVLALVAVWAAHWAAREAGLAPRWAFLVAVTLLVNPLFLNLSYTFMTDVPFLALTTLSAAAFLRALRTARVGWLWLAGVLAVAAFFIRQFALLIPVAFATALAVTYARNTLFQDTVPDRKPGQNDRTSTLHAVAALLLPWLGAFALLKILPVGGEGFGTWDWNLLGNTLTDRASGILRHVSAAFTYLALFALPIFCAVRFTGQGHPYRRTIVWLVIGVIWFLFVLAETPERRLPWMGNLLYDAGVGPLLLPGMLADNAIAAPVHLGPAAWWGITAFAMFGAVLLIDYTLVRTGAALKSSRTAPSASARELFLVLYALATIFVLILPAVLARFDRYFLGALVPITLIASLHFANQWELPSIRAFIAAAAVWLIGVVCLQDYLAWNTVRWESLTALQGKHHAPLEQINGGYEFNGLFHSDFYAEESRRTGKKVFGPQGWWIRGDTYRVSLRPNNHFEIIDRVPYYSWLGFERREILLLKRTEPDANSDLFN